MFATLFNFRRCINLLPKCMKNIGIFSPWWKLYNCFYTWYRALFMSFMWIFPWRNLWELNGDGTKYNCLFEIQSIVHERPWVSYGQAPLIDFLQWMLVDWPWASTDHVQIVSGCSRISCHWSWTTCGWEGWKSPLYAPRAWAVNWPSTDGQWTDHGCSWMLVDNIVESVN